MNGKQIIAIAIAVLSVLAVSTASLNDILGPQTAKIVVSVAGLFNTILSSILAVYTSQNSTVQAVLAMPGVDKIDVNEQANKALSQMAVDPTVNKIAPTQEAFDTVTQTAKGA